MRLKINCSIPFRRFVTFEKYFHSSRLKIRTSSERPHAKLYSEHAVAIRLAFARLHATELILDDYYENIF
jgi:hypothetical protein